MSVLARPKHQRPPRVDDGGAGCAVDEAFRKARGDQLLRIPEIGGKKDIERRTVLDLGGKRGGGLVGGFGVNAGLLLELFQDRRQHWLKVGGRGNANRSLRRDG